MKTKIKNDYKYSGYKNNHEYKKYIFMDNDWISIYLLFYIIFFVIVNPHYIGIVLPLISILLAQSIYNYDNDFKQIKLIK